MSTTPILLKNDYISLEVLPEMGGKITSLKNVSNDYEWLWINPHLEMRKPVYGESFVENIDFGGWDEIFPSVSPTKLANGIDIPDHGDIVFLPAEVIEQSETSLTLSWVTQCVQCRFTRQLTLEGETLLADYTLESLTDEPIPYLWAAHPLLRLEHGMRLEIPCDPASIQYLDTDEKPLPFLTISDHQAELKIEDPDSASASSNSQLALARKFFCPSVSQCQLHAPDLDAGTISFSWDSKSLPYLGIWLNQRGWSGSGSAPYFNMGLEPTTSPQDDLLDAMQLNQHHELEPKGSHQWSLRVSLSS